MEEPTNCLYGPPEGEVNHPKPLIVTNNMQEHGYLFFNRCMYAISDKLSTTKNITKLEKRGSPHSKKVDTVHIIRFIDVSKVVHPLFVPLSQGTIGD